MPHEKIHRFKKTKIAFLGNQITFGGGATSLYLLVKSLSSLKYDKYVYATNIASPEMLKHYKKHCISVEKINIEEIKSSQTSLTPLRQFIIAKLSAKIQARRLLKKLLENNIDILHINNSVFSHLYKYIKKYNKNIKIITHVRELILSNPNNIISYQIIENIKSYSDAIITISDNEAKPFLNNKELYIIPNPFDFDQVLNVKNVFREKYNLENETVLVGMIGRFVKNKGHLLFLKVLEKLKKSIKNEIKFKFVLVGANASYSRIKDIFKKIFFKENYRKVVLDYIEKNSLQDNIIVLPYTKNIFNIIQALDIIVRPSLNGDPWGRDIIESMAFKKPVIATGYSNYFIENDVNGFLVGEDIDLLKNRLSLLICNENLRKEFGNRGFSKIKKMCDIKNYGEKIDEIYRRIK